MRMRMLFARVSYWVAMFFAGWFVCAVCDAATCVSLGNTEAAKGLAEAVCGTLHPVKVTVKEKPKLEFAIKVELTASQSEQFRKAEEREVTQTLTGLCIVLGSRIFRARALRWELRDPDGKLVVESPCPELASDAAAVFPSGCGSIPPMFVVKEVL